MATRPDVRQSLDATGAAGAQGVDYCTVFAAVPTDASFTPRVFLNAAAIYAQHGYSEGLEYCALHFEATRKPILFVPLPISTQGVVGREESSGNTGSSVCSVTAGSDGALCETDGEVTVIRGGTVGTDQIMLGLSLDGGWTVVPVRLGTATSYAIPYSGLTLSFTVGTLVAGDTIKTWHTTAPRWTTTDLAAAKSALVAQQKLSRTWKVVGDLNVKADADAVLAIANAYQSSNNRYTSAQCELRDRLPYATMSHGLVRMSAATVTFANVSSTDTITRGTGSFVSDGFHSGGWIRITGSVSNNTSGAATVAASVLTFGAAVSLTNEGPVAGVSITCEAALTFADNGASADTLTRTSGSWISDGFRVGDSITITGTASNNVTATITVLTATVLTVATGTFAAEVIGINDVTITAGETKAAWIATLDGLFAAIDAQPRINLSVGRARVISPFSGWSYRRPCAWADSITSYQHDVHIATWEQEKGPLTGWDLNDADGNLYEFDERVDGGALAARFTCFCTLDNGPAGTFICRSLTRASDGNVLSNQASMNVANLAQSVLQKAAMIAGRNLVLNTDGTMTTETRKKIEKKFNAALANEITVDKGEGQRASYCVVTLATNDIMNVAEPLLHGTMDLICNGLLHTIVITTRVLSGGATE